MLYVFIKNTPEVPTLSLPPLISLTNYGNTTNREDFNEPIQYMNDSPNNNPIPFTTGVYNQEPITYNIHILCSNLKLLHNIQVQDMQI